MTERSIVTRRNTPRSRKNPSARRSALVALETIDLEVPDRLGQMIEARVARLSKEEQRVLEAASITGMTFSPRVNAANTNLHQACFEEICETLARRHAIVRALGTRQFPNTAISSRYEFIHAMYREVLYLRQSPGRRATLHRRIGGRLEELFAGRVGDVAAELAWHFEQGFDHDRAARYQRLTTQGAAMHAIYGISSDPTGTDAAGFPRSATRAFFGGIRVTF
jgi:hypothetical protein